MEKELDSGYINTPTRLSQRVPVERTLIAQHQQIVVCVASSDSLLAVLLEQLVPLLVFAVVRPAQHEYHGDGGNAHGQTGRKAGGVLWLLAREVDVAAHDAAHVADGDEQRHADGALGARGQRVA